jgi:glycosyltransferase involved in cell wall biosynthesis
MPRTPRRPALACGLITEIGDSDQIAQGLIALLMSHEIQNRLGAIGRERVCRNYHENQTLGAYWEMYRQLAFAERATLTTLPQASEASAMNLQPL